MLDGFIPKLKHFSSKSLVSYFWQFSEELILNRAEIKLLQHFNSQEMYSCVLSRYQGY